MSETAEVVTKRSNGIARIRSAAAAAAALATTRGRGRAALDPREQEDQEQRRDRERVPLLDPVGEPRGEGADDEQRPERRG